MKIEFDPVADALYIKLSDSKVIESEAVQPGVILDFDEYGKVIGVEILSVSKLENSPLKNAA